MARMKKGKERVEASASRKVLDFDGSYESSELDGIDERRSAEPEVKGSRQSRRVLTLESESEDGQDDEVCDWIDFPINIYQIDLSSTRLYVIRRPQLELSKIQLCRY